MGFRKIVVAALLTVTVFAGTACSSGYTEEAKPGQETVILLHGLGRSALAMWQLENHLEDAGYHVVSLDYDSIGASPDDILTSITRQIDICCENPATRLHFVGHSMGGLMIRAWLAEHHPETLGHVVMLGTPNGGTTFVDSFRDKWWLRMLGDMTLALGTDREGFAASLPKPAYSVGVIAGEIPLDNEDYLPGPDDGLVSVESTRLDGMADFMVLPVHHAGLRNDDRVADQVVHFLQNGKFQAVAGKDKG